ncbi:phytoene/squalene synthase family protein [Pedobacter sandarakinus]|uniref:phytoene/squalene synthase family protein n=1 Tax=Pedobacter sandarakinus TaxID=353156 RepID=UPI002247D72A|nr:phytoene/squalene synthase family protein [Pedobacter sandarakinus]MCX2574093.1 phytoene/squalene synthase family protein [Pedobacter sandarakinus]
MKEIFDHVSDDCSKLVTRRYSTSFSLGIRFLAKELQGPICAIYGFVRLADEIVDSFHGFDKAQLLAKFDADCFDAIKHHISLNPILNAFQKTINTYNIDPLLVKTFLHSMEMDLDKIEYTEDKYEEYILGSAQVVGLMCLYIFVEGKEEAYQKLKDSAMKLGSAFQKVNFLRDLSMDYQLLNRSYFPNVDAGNFSLADKKAIEEDIEAEFMAALSGIKQLPKSSQKGVYLAYTYYYQLFKKISKTPPEKILAKRIRISNPRKFGLMFSAVVRYQVGMM